jgi:hypothetical protein
MAEHCRSEPRGLTLLHCNLYGHVGIDRDMIGQQGSAARLTSDWRGKRATIMTIFEMEQLTSQRLARSAYRLLRDIAAGQLTDKQREEYYSTQGKLIDFLDTLGICAEDIN